MIRVVCALLSILLLTACGTSKPPYKGIKIGKPYEVNGQIYVPKYKPDYDEVGIASWYGPGFHGGHTASGERYDQNDLTAAHKTLPLPSLVRVTNLDNGMSAVLRVNDRGPFVSRRIIDLSKGSAIKLGVYRSGTAKVRVEFLDKETREYVSHLPNGAQSLAALDRYKANNTHVVENVRHQEIVEIADAAPEGNVTSNDLSNSEQLPFTAPPITGRAATASNWTPSDPAVAPHQTIVASNKPIVSGYYIQVATYGVKSNADRMYERIAQITKARIGETDVSDRKFYRVQAGPFNSSEEAKKMLSKLATIGISGAKIIKN